MGLCFLKLFLYEKTASWPAVVSVHPDDPLQLIEDWLVRWFTLFSLYESHMVVFLCVLGTVASECVFETMVNITCDLKP